MITPQQMTQLKAIVPPAGGAAPGGAPSGGWYSQVVGSQAAPAQAPSAQTAAPKLGSDSLGIGQYAGDAIKTQAESGVKQMEQSYQDAKTATNPLSKTEAGMGMLAGGIGAATAPLAPALKPIGDVASWLGEKIGNTKAAQDFVQQHPDAASALSRIATDAGNTSAVLGTALGGPKAVEELPSSLADANGQVTEAAKTGAAKIKESITPKPASAVDVAAKAAKSQATAHEAIDTEVRNMAEKYPTVGKALNTAETASKTDPIGVLSSYAKGEALPTIAKGKLQVDKAVAFLQKKVGDFSEIKDKMVEASSKNTGVDDFRSKMNDIIDSQSWSAEKKAATKSDVAKMTDGLKGVYPEGISGPEMDSLKTEHAAESKSYNSKSPFSLDSHAIVAKAARQTVEKNGGEAPIAELNKHIQSHYDAIKLLQTMRGTAPHGGALSRMMNNTLGEVAGLGGGLAVGHPFLGAMAGRAGAEAISELINNHFISNPLKRSLVNNMKGADPAVMQAALDYLDKSGAEPGDKVPTEVNGGEDAEGSK